MASYSPRYSVNNEFPLEICLKCLAKFDKMSSGMVLANCPLGSSDF
jgi:hypothetical protein